jgi:hypothetical protein
VQKTVFILGAGASVEAGGPLMSTFLDEARDLLVSGRVKDKQGDFERVFHALVRLRDVFYKSGLDLDNIESVFGAFEMARIIGKLGDYPTRTIAAIAKSIRVVIVRTLDELIKCSYNPNSTEGGLLPSPSYGHFVRQIQRMNSPSNCQFACSVLTFNYDIALDYALMCAHISHDYGLEASIDRKALRLLKLHGSLNWGKCPNCRRIRAAHLSEEEILEYANTVNSSMFPLRTAQIFAKATCDKCGVPLTQDPVIVPPTWNKTEGHKELMNVWRQAAIELSQAENIICMGYSLPETDLFFRYLFALGTVGDAHLRRFWVFDPNAEGAIEERYRRLLGRGIEGKFRPFKCRDGRFGYAAGDDELWKPLCR